MKINEQAPQAGAGSSGAAVLAEAEDAVMRHLRDIRDLENRIGGDPMPEFMAVEMAWSRWAAKLPNDDLACVIHVLLEDHVKPANILWAKLREIVIRLMERPKAKRAPRRKRPNAQSSATGAESPHQT